MEGCDHPFHSTLILRQQVLYLMKRTVEIRLAEQPFETFDLFDFGMS